MSRFYRLLPLPLLVFSVLLLAACSPQNQEPDPASFQPVHFQQLQVSKTACLQGLPGCQGRSLVAARLAVPKGWKTYHQNSLETIAAGQGSGNSMVGPEQRDGCRMMVWLIFASSGLADRVPEGFLAPRRQVLKSGSWPGGGAWNLMRSGGIISYGPKGEYPYYPTWILGASPVVVDAQGKPMGDKATRSCPKSQRAWANQTLERLKDQVLVIQSSLHGPGAEKPSELSKL